MAQLVSGSRGLAWSTTERSRLHRLGSRAHSRPAFIRADAGRMAADKPPSPASQVVIAARHCSRAGRCGARSTPQRPGGRAPPVALTACHHEGACVWTHWSMGHWHGRRCEQAAEYEAGPLALGARATPAAQAVPPELGRRSMQRSRRTGPLLSHAKRAALGSCFAARRWRIGRTTRLGQRVNGPSPGEAMVSLAGGEGRRWPPDCPARRGLSPAERPQFSGVRPRAPGGASSVLCPQQHAVFWATASNI